MDGFLQNNDLSEAEARYGQGKPIYTPETELAARDELAHFDHTTENIERVILQHQLQNETANQPKMSPDELNTQFPGMETPFKEPMNFAVANDIATFQNKKKALQDIINNGPQETTTKLKAFGHNLLAGALDPVNFLVGSTIGPIVGAAATAVGIGEAMGIGALAPTLAQYVGRVGTEAAIANAPAAASSIASKFSQHEQVDPVAEMQSYVGNTIGAAVLLGGGHYAFNRFIMKPKILPSESGSVDVKSRPLPTEPVQPDKQFQIGRPYTPSEAEVIHTVASSQIEAGQRVNIEPINKALESGVEPTLEDVKNIAAQQHAPENKINYNPEVVKALENTERQLPTVEQADLEKKFNDKLSLLKKMGEGEEVDPEVKDFLDKFDKLSDHTKTFEKVKGLAIDCVGKNG